MKRWMMALGTIAMLAAACKPLVIDGGGGGSGGGNTGGDAMGGAQAYTPSAIAIRLADMPADSLAVVEQNTGLPTDPDTLVLVFTSMPESCSAPVVATANMECDSPAPFWQLALFIPPALQGGGPIDLQQEQVFFYASEVFEPTGPAGSCAGGTGTGPGTQGTLVIDSSNPDALQLTLSGGVSAMAVDIDGTYTAAMCP